MRDIKSAWYNMVQDKSSHGRQKTKGLKSHRAAHCAHGRVNKGFYIMIGSVFFDVSRDIGLTKIYPVSKLDKTFG